MASFRTRKMIANGVFMSKLIYLMPVWMGCEEYLVNALQVCQNKAARTVTRLDRFTSTKVLLLQCGWLSVRQLMLYHSLVLLYKTIKHKKPEFLHQKVTSGSHKPRTRQATARRKSWCWSSVYWYNQLPLNLQSEAKLQIFKSRLKHWILVNLDLSSTIPTIKIKNQKIKY